MGRGSLLAHPIPTSVPIPEKSLQPSKLIDQGGTGKSRRTNFELQRIQAFGSFGREQNTPVSAGKAEHSMGTKTGARVHAREPFGSGNLMYGSLASMARAAPMQEVFGGPASGQIIVSLRMLSLRRRAKWWSSPKFRSGLPKVPPVKKCRCGGFKPVQARS